MLVDIHGCVRSVPATHGSFTSFWTLSGMVYSCSGPMRVVVSWQSGQYMSHCNSLFSPISLSLHEIPQCILFRLVVLKDYGFSVIAYQHSTLSPKCLASCLYLQVRLRKFRRSSWIIVHGVWSPSIFLGLCSHFRVSGCSISEILISLLEAL